MTRHVVAREGEIPPGGRKIVTLDGRSIGVFHVNGEYFALLNRCPHQGGPLCEGKLWSALEAARPGEYRTSRDGEILACPWHGWEYDLRTGASWCEPRRLRVPAYEVHIEAEAAPAAAEEHGAPPGRVPGPYAAETFAVSREGGHIVVDLSRRASASRAPNGTDRG